MAGTKLDLLIKEVNKYQNLPYFCNRGIHKNISTNNALVGKGSAHDIALTTLEIAGQKNIKLSDLTPVQVYNFQKKHHLGIDCSGLACQLLNFHFSLSLDPRKTSANHLTSAPLSTAVKLDDVRPGDLIRQKNGRHVLFVINRLDDTVTFVDSSRDDHGVKISTFFLSRPNIKIDGVYRLTSLQSIPDILTD
jgi:hypothetical protein